MLKRLNQISKIPKYFRFFSLSAFAGSVVSVRVNRKKSVKMQEGYITINKVPTHIFTWKNWIDDKFDEKTKEMVLVITGNPGKF